MQPSNKSDSLADKTSYSSCELVMDDKEPPVGRARPARSGQIQFPLDPLSTVGELFQSLTSVSIDNFCIVSSKTGAVGGYVAQKKSESDGAKFMIKTALKADSNERNFNRNAMCFCYCITL